METSYDENLLENPFFQVLCRDYGALLERAVRDGLIICVPRCGSLGKCALVQEDFLRHILEPNGQTCVSQFRALSGKEVKVSNRVLTVEYDIAKPCSARLLFDETFYTDECSKYSVWCIERPLEQSISASRDDVIVVTNVREALHLLWTQVYNKDIIKDMTMAIEEFQDNHDNMEKVPLNTQRDLVGALYAINLRMLLQDVRLREKTESNRHFLQTIKVAAETYTLHGLRNFLPRAVSGRTSQEDASLNKTIKNLHHVELSELGVRTEMYDSILLGKLELSRLNVYSTVLDKIGCLNKCLRYATEGTGILSSDELLPVLIFLVIRAGLPNWMAQLAFMKQFRFSVNSTNESDEAGFLLTSLEAAVEHVRLGVPKSSSSQGMYTNVESRISDSRSNSKEEGAASVDNLFSAIRESNLSEVERILVGQGIKNKPSLESVELCHPLCTCECCEKRLAGAWIADLPTVNSSDDRGMTGIHVAALCGRVNMVDFLLERGADPNSCDADGTRPLHCAASRGHQNSLLLLLHANADPAAANSRGDTPLHLASDNGHEDCVKALLYFTEQMGIIINKSPMNSNGETPLHHASKWGYGGIVEILMEHGADPRATNRRGQTPLVVAHSSLVLRLLENSSNRLSAKVIKNFTPRPPAANMKKNIGDKPPIESSSGSGSSSSNDHKLHRLLAAIAENDSRLACYYLGLQQPSKSPLDETRKLCHPLCNCDDCASSTEESSDKPEIKESLGLNIGNERNETALHAACHHGRTEFVQVLLDAGANVNLRTIDGRTPLHLACLGGWVKIVKLLLDCGNCYINEIDAAGDSCLHLAARKANYRIVQMLIRYGADTNIRNFRGIIPLDEMEKYTCHDNITKQSFSSIIKILKNNRAHDTYNNEIE